MFAGRVSSGAKVPRAAPGRRSQWVVDVLIELDDGRTLVVEYDVSYWHANKTEIDTVKTVDLLASGHRVVRLREHPLEGLPVDDENYLEVPVYATAPNPEGVMHQAADWVWERTVR